MHLKVPQTSHRRRKSDDRDARDWAQMVDTLAMQLCPAEEWQYYEQKQHALIGLAQQKHSGGQLYVFPLWRKYRMQASRVASLYQAVPILRRAPLRVGSLLANLLLK